MNKPKIYIDGKEGTTGLQIYERLGGRDDLELLLIDEDKRKDTEERRKFLNAADLVFLCLPDAAAVEAVSLIENSKTKVIDASTAHRTAPGWVYGFPELKPGQRQAIAGAKRVANPGCHATGFISIVYPLIQCGILSPEETVTAYSLSGYSGGGKKMIAQYEAGKDEALLAPRLYGLSMKHKHLPEMKSVCGLSKDPLFCPVVDDYYRGMATSIMLDSDAAQVHAALDAFYRDGLVHVRPFGEEGTISANAMAGRDDLALIVCGRKEQTIVTALFDNLGKGACGAAIQNMNIMLNFEETEGLNL